MTIHSLSIDSPGAPSSAAAETALRQDIALINRIKSTSNENIKMASLCKKETMLDYLYQARKYYVENKQHTSIHVYDRMFLQDLINGEQKRKPGLLITLANSAQEFTARIISLRKNKATLYHGQFIVNMGKEVHYAALDVFIANGNMSIIGNEPANMNSQGPKFLLLRLLAQVRDNFPAARFVMMESDIQQSPVDCAIFSLHFALKMHASKPLFAELHKQHINGDLNKHIRYGYISRKDVDHYLPVEFMKHTNSRKRLNSYFINNEKIAAIAKNKDLIIERQKRFTFDRGERSYSASIEDKRIKFIERTIKSEPSGVKKLPE